MPTFRTTRPVKHTPAQMFALVADVERYPEFLPLCEDLRIMRRVQSGEGIETPRRLHVGRLQGHQGDLHHPRDPGRSAPEDHGRIRGRAVQISREPLDLPRGAAAAARSSSTSITSSRASLSACSWAASSTRPSASSPKPSRSGRTRSTAAPAKAQQARRLISERLFQQGQRILHRPAAHSLASEIAIAPLEMHGRDAFARQPEMDEPDRLRRRPAGRAGDAGDRRPPHRPGNGRARPRPWRARPARSRRHGRRSGRPERRPARSWPRWNRSRSPRSTTAEEPEISVSRAATSPPVQDSAVAIFRPFAV